MKKTSLPSTITWRRSFLKISCLLLWAGGSFSIASGQEMLLSYDFDSGDLQGWENVKTSDVPNGPTRFEILENPDSISYIPETSGYMAAPIPFGNNVDGGRTRDSQHNTLVLRSPEFYLGVGPISFDLSGGTGSTFPPASFGSLPIDSSTNGFLGVALRRTSDDAYVMTASKGTNGRGWEKITWSEESLSGFVSNDEAYTLDLIDTSHANWSWVAMDNVSISGTVIPEPSSYALFFGAAAGAAVFVRRKKRAKV